MHREPISDLDDPCLAPYRHLKATNATRGNDLFVVEGETLVDRLLASRFPTVSVLVTDRFETRIASRIPDDAPLIVVPHDRVEDLVGFHFHRGILACGRRRPWPLLSSILRDPASRASFVVCPTLDIPDNLGAILRIGDAFGVDAILVGDRCPDPLSRRVIRVSMGAALRLPVYTPDDLMGTVQQLRDGHGLEIVAAVARPDAELLDCARRPDRLALLLGGEAFGLEPCWEALAHRRVTIPMRAGADSLNVAVAAGIILHHFARPDLSAPGVVRNL